VIDAETFSAATLDKMRDVAERLGSARMFHHPVRVRLSEERWRELEAWAAENCFPPKAPDASGLATAKLMGVDVTLDPTLTGRQGQVDYSDGASRPI